MTAIGILIGLFLLLFLVSRVLTRTISGLILHVTRQEKAAVFALAILFFPGTVIHEVAHYLMAHILFVRAGNMVLFPRLEGNGVRLGSVSIEKTDPFRRMIIGVAPILIGTSLLFLLLYYATIQNYSLFSLPMIGIGYFVFEIGNTMFSSKKDLEGVIELVLALIIIAGILFFLGVRLPENFFTFLESDEMRSLFQKGSIVLIVPILIDVALIGVFSLLKKILLR